MMRSSYVVWRTQSLASLVNKVNKGLTSPLFLSCKRLQLEQELLYTVRTILRINKDNPCHS
jgi:hypothetical protein